MQVGVIGLGRLGASLVRRLLAADAQCVVYDTDPTLVAVLAAERALGATSAADLANELDGPRIILLALPARAVDGALAQLMPRLEHGDIVADVGDAHYVDDIRRAAALAALGVSYIDVGVSGTFDCPSQGYCLTVGGEPAAVRSLDPVLQSLAPVPRATRPLAAAPQDGAARGVLHCGPPGAGRFASMIHNAVATCVMAAYDEGFTLLRNANVGRRDRRADGTLPRILHPEHYQYDFDLAAIVNVWRHTILASPVMELTAAPRTKDGADPGDGRDFPRRDWPAMRAAVDEAIAIPVLASAMYATRAGKTDVIAQDVRADVA